MAKHGMRMRLNPSVLKKLREKNDAAANETTATAAAASAESDIDPEPSGSGISPADCPATSASISTASEPPPSQPVSEERGVLPFPEIYKPIDRLRYSPELGRKICRLIASGQTVTALCRRSDMPGSASVFVWLREHEEFRKQYVLAVQFARDRLDDQILDIADDLSKDVVSLKDRTGQSREVLNPVAVQRARVRVIARQRMIDRNKAMKQQPHIDESGNPTGAQPPAPPAPTGEIHYRLTEERRAELMARRKAQIEASEREREGKLPPTPDTPNSTTGQ